MEKKFKLGFMVGRMQPVHKGHQQLIDLGIQLCDKFIILLGSANNSNSVKNPFTFEERKEFITKVYGDKVEVYPIVDIGIGYVPEWGNYLINTIKYYTNFIPDFTICGTEEGRSSYLDNFDITKLIVSRTLIPISATDVRSIIQQSSSIDDCKQQLKNLVDDSIIPDIIKTYKNKMLN